jgi:peptidoglycan hydrolase-like protein with peptidoglycan-binding domain
MRASLAAMFAAAVLAATWSVAAAKSCRTEFAPGLEATAVRDIQEQLRAHGFNPGPIDGELGPKTCAAVRDYQKSVGLPADGVLDQSLQNHMHFVASGGGATRK